MGLVDDLVKEQERRKLSRLETLEAEASRRDLDVSMGGAAELRDDRGFFTNAITNPLKRGTVGSGGRIGSGIEAVGERLQDSKRELTIKEYQQNLNQDIGKDLAKQVSDSEKWMMDDSLVASHIPTNLELKSMHDTPAPSQAELEEALTPVGDTYRGERSTMLHIFRPTDPRTGKMVKQQTKSIPFEEMTPLEQNIQIAKNAVGKTLTTAGSFYAEGAEKIIEDNPQWQPPEHLQGRPAFKSLWADDLTFGDKATVVMGTFMENVPQIAATLGLTVGGAALGGPAGAIAGGTLSIGGNFLLETGDVYQAITEAHPNINKGDAAGTAIVHGLAASSLELAPVGTLLNRIPGVKKAVMGATLRELLKKPKLVQRTLRGMIEQGAVEGITEGLQEISANAAKSVYEQNPEYFKDIDESVFMGFLMGVVTGGLGNMMTHRSAVKQFNDERLIKLDSNQLLELANDPELLAQEKLSPKEVYAAAEQVRIAEGLETVNNKMQEGGLSLEELAGTEAEQAARYLARIRDPERSATITRARAMIREKNLSDKDLQLLMKSSKQLEEVGLLPEHITSLVEERAEEQRYVKHFETMLKNAPSDAMRQGIMDSLQGAYYQGISRVLEAKGKKAARSDLMKGEVEIPKPKKKTVTKKKAAVKPKVKKKAAEDLTGPEIAAMSPKERAQTVLGEEATPEEVEVLTKQIVAFQEKEKAEAKPKPKLDTLYKTKAAAMVAINKIENKEEYSILKTKDGFKIIAEPVLGSSKPVVAAASKDLGSEIKYDSSMDQGEDFGVWHGYTFLEGPAKGGSFTVITQSNIEPTAEEIVDAGQKILNLRKVPLGAKVNKESDKLYADTKEYIIQQLDDGVTGKQIVENMIQEGWDKKIAQTYFDQMKFIDRLQNPDRPMNRGRATRFRSDGSFLYEYNQSKTKSIPAIDFITKSRWDFNRSRTATVAEMVELGWTEKDANKFNDLYETVRKLDGNRTAIIQFVKKNPDYNHTRLFRAAKIAFDSRTVYDTMGGISSAGTGVTVTEAEARVKKILGNIPKFIKITEELDPEVQKALDNRTKSGAIPLASTKELFKAPKWTSRIITDFVDQGGKKGGHKTADQWIIAIQQWTTDKTKKGKVVEGSAQMPSPVRDELLWSGLPEWLEDRADRELPTTKEDIVEYLEKYNRYVFTEKIYGYDFQNTAPSRENFNKQTKLNEAIASNHRATLRVIVPEIQKQGIEDILVENFDFDLSSFVRDLNEAFTATADNAMTMSTITEEGDIDPQALTNMIHQVFKESPAGLRYAEELKKQKALPEGFVGFEEELTFDEKITELFEPIIEDVKDQLYENYDYLKELRELELELDAVVEPEADTHAQMVLDDGSLSTQERTHILNIPNARKRVFVVARPELDPDTGEIIHSSLAREYYETMEEAEKALVLVKNAKDQDWVVKTEFLEERLKENWTPVHYSNMNNVMWLRADVREHAETLKKVFVIHEMQSDWIQQAKKHGFANKAKYRAAEAKAKKAEFWASMNFKKILDTPSTAGTIADPTSREAFKVFYEWMDNENLPITDSEIAQILDHMVDKQNYYFKREQAADDWIEEGDSTPFTLELRRYLEQGPIGGILKNHFLRDYNLDPILNEPIDGPNINLVPQDESQAEQVDLSFWKLVDWFIDENNFYDIIKRAANENRKFKGFIYEKHAMGYPGLTEDVLRSIRDYILRLAPKSPVTAEDIRNLNPVTFRNQFKKIGKRHAMPNADLAYKLLSRAQLEKVQELFALWTDAAQFTSDIPKPPMHNTFHLYGLKRATQQAVMEGHDYVAWPSSPRQVAQIEGYGEVLSTPKGRHIVFANRAVLEEMMKVSQDPNLDTIEKVLDYELDKEVKDLKKNTLRYNPVDPKFRNVTAIINRYIKDMPRSANKFFKKYGTKVEEINLAGPESKSMVSSQQATEAQTIAGITVTPKDRIPIQGFKITPELKAAIIKGLPVASKNDVYQAAYYKGNIHVAANALETVDEVKGLLVHEGGHYLRRNDEVYQEKYQQLWDQFISLAMTPHSSREAAAIADAFQQAMREKDVLDKDLVREEALMYFLQNEANQEFSLWKKFVNLIKQWLHRTFGKTPEQLNMSGQELAQVIIYDLKKHIKAAEVLDQEVAVETEEAFGAAKKRDDIKEYKPNKASKLLDDIFGVHVDKKTTEAQHAYDSAMAIANLQNISKDPDVKAMAYLTNRIIKGDLENVKAFKRTKHEQTATWLNRVFSSPEYYFTKDTTANRILNIAKNKNDIKFQWKKRVEGDFIATVRHIKKKNPKAYIKANKYLVNTDKTGKGFKLITGEDGTFIVMSNKNKRIASFTNEQAAISTMIQSEIDYLKKMGYSTNAIEVIEEARWLTNRGFDLTVEDMRRQIDTAKDQGNEEPKIPFTDDEGIKGDISLSEAITRMGDLRGTYFPRERQAKEYQLTAQGEGKTNQLFTYNVYIPANIKDFPSLTKLKTLFNKNTPVGKKMRELEKAGYTDISLKPIRNPTGMIFDVPGLLMSMDALLSASDAKLSELELEEHDKLILKTASEQLTLRIADIYKAKGQLSSRLRRSKILWEGYEEDALKALTSYAQRVSTGAAMRETARAMLLTFTGRDVPWKDYKADNPDASYRSYRILVKQKAINSTTQKKLYEDVRTYMTYVLKPDTRLDRTIGYFKAAATFKFLGLRLSSAAINMTNMVMAVPATMSAHTGQSLTRSWGHVTEAADKYALWRLEQLKLTSDLSSTLQRKMERLSKGIVLSNKDRIIFEEISRRGWDEAQFNHDAARVLQDSPNRVFDMALRVSMYMFGATEKANRAMTIFAAYKAHEAAQKKKGVTRSHEFYLKMAQQTSDRAHGTYGKAAKPWLVQKARVLDLPYTFLKFQHNYMLNMAETGIKGFQNRKKLSAIKNVTYMLMAPAIVAGTRASLLAKLAFTIIGKMFDEPDPEEQFYQWFEDTFGEDTFMSRGARHGAAGAMFHVNLRGSIQMNNPLPTDLSEAAGAPGAIVTDLYDSMVYFSKHEWMKGAEKFSPTFLGSAIKARRESTEGVTTGTYMPVFYGTERLKADPMDAALRYLSFNPSRLSGIREKQWRELKVDQMFTERRSEIKRNINQMLVQGTASEEKWADIFNQIQEYNNRAMVAPKKYRVTLITDKWIMRAIRDTEIPKKKEKIRGAK